jgi:hypothetical protein
MRVGGMLCRDSTRASLNTVLFKAVIGETNSTDSLLILMKRENRVQSLLKHALSKDCVVARTHGEAPRQCPRTRVVGLSASPFYLHC